MSSGEKEGTKCNTTWQHGFIMTGHDRIRRIDQNIASHGYGNLYTVGTEEKSSPEITST